MAPPMTRTAYRRRDRPRHRRYSGRL